jgi:hypothetical protein
MEKLLPNTLYYSATGDFVVEVKQITGSFISTITFQKMEVGLLPMRADPCDSFERITKFLVEN